MTASTSATSGFRSSVTALVEAPWFNAFITFVIILNAITLGCATYQGWSAQTLSFFRWFDAAVTFIFVVEIGLKLIAYRGAFFKNGWNVFDFAIVAIALAPVSQSFSVLRALRVLRVLRLISVVPMLRKVVEALFRAIPGMGAIAAVLALMIYVAAVMATTMYGASVPELFGSLERSAFTLFQVMTMDGWRNEAVQPVMDAGHPFAWVFFLLFILVGSFAVLNLFIGLIVEAMNDDIEKDVERLEAGHVAAHEEREDMLALLSAMRAEIAELKAAIDAKD